MWGKKEAPYSVSVDTLRSSSINRDAQQQSGDSHFALDFYADLRPSHQHNEPDNPLAGSRQVPKFRCCGGVTRTSLMRTLLTTLFLVSMGIAGTAFLLGVELLHAGLFELRNLLEDVLPKNEFLLFLVVLALSALFGLLASACVSACPAAAGSGIPEVKSMLTGIVLFNFLTYHTLFFKVFGLTFAVASGLFIGKEGPFVHISIIIAHAILSAPVFAALMDNGPLRLELLGAAVAVGVTATFGAPIGGTLFSIEVTSIYYLVANLPKSFLASVVGMLVMRAFASNQWISNHVNLALFSGDEILITYTPVELIVFVALGVLTGLLSGMFIFLIGSLVQLRKRVGARVPPALQVIGVCLLCATVRFLTRELAGDALDLPALLHTERLRVASPVLSLLAQLPVSILFSAAAAVLPVPCGVFTPAFYSGAVTGRLLGEVLRIIFPSSDIDPEGYALVGGAAFAAGVTRTISTAIIGIELTGNLYYSVPIFVAVTASYLTANVFSASVYEVILALKGLPFLPTLDPRSYHRKAVEVMRHSLRVLPADATYLDVLAVLRGNDYTSFPWVVSLEDRVFIGTVLRASLEEALDRRVHVLAAMEEAHRASETGRVAALVGNPSLNAGLLGDDAELEVEAAEHRTTIGTPMVSMADPTSAAGSSRRAAVVSRMSRKRAATTNFSMDTFNSHIEAETTAAILSKLGEQPFEFNNPSIIIDDAPFQIVPQTSLQRLDFLMKMAGLSHAWVVHRGRLEGVVTKKDLISFETSLGD